MTNKMPTYIVVQWGVYIQDIFGPYKSKGEAIKNADRLAAADVDSYHYWYVYELKPKGLPGKWLYETRKPEKK